MSQTIRSVACLGCGCACDDIDVVIDDGRIREIRRTCELGNRWFAHAEQSQPCRVAGRPASTDEALSATARLIMAAAAPLIYLAPELTCDAQREAVALADRLGAAIDSVSSSPGTLAALLAAQEEGRISATLGEVRNRSDLLIFWGTDPVASYPRFWSRYAPEPPGRYVPNGRRSRRIVSVDIGDQRGPADADVRLTIDTADEAAALRCAAALTGTADAGGDRLDRHARTTRIAGLAAQLVSAVAGAHYVTLIVDGESGERDAAAAGALARFVRGLNDVCRAALITLRGGGNRSGADAVLTWQTGFPIAVDFSRGYPEYRPFDGSAAARLARTGTDAVLVVGAPRHVPDMIRARLLATPCVIIGPLADFAGIDQVAAAIDTGVAGVHEGGLAYRMDDVPVRLQTVLGARPLVAPLLRQLRQRCLAS